MIGFVQWKIFKYDKFLTNDYLFFVPNMNFFLFIIRKIYLQILKLIWYCLEPLYKLRITMLCWVLKFDIFSFLKKNKIQKNQNLNFNLADLIRNVNEKYLD